MNYLEAFARGAIRRVTKEIRILAGREPRTYKSREAAIQATAKTVVRDFSSDYSPPVSILNEDGGDLNIRQNENGNR